MIPYIFIGLLLFLLSVRFKNISKNNGFIAFFVLFLLAALRASTIGIDLAGYISDFNTGHYLIEYQTEKGFSLLLDVIKIFNKNQQFFITITSFVIYFLIFLFLRKTSPNIAFSLFIFFILSNESGYLFTFSGLRQSIALGFILWSFYYFSNKKFLLSSLFYLIAFSFHNSAIFALPIVLIASSIKNLRFFSIIIIISSVLGFWGVIELSQFSTNISIVDSYIVLYSNYMLESRANIFGLVAVIIPNTFFALFSIRKNINDLYSKIFYTGVAGSNLLAIMPNVQRFFFYYVILQILIIPQISNKIKGKNEKILFYFSILILTLYFVYWLYRLTQISQSNYFQNLIVPYKTFLNN